MPENTRQDAVPPITAMDSQLSVPPTGEGASEVPAGMLGRVELAALEGFERETSDFPQCFLTESSIAMMLRTSSASGGRDTSRMRMPRNRRITSQSIYSSIFRPQRSQTSCTIRFCAVFFSNSRLPFSVRRFRPLVVIRPLCLRREAKFFQRGA